MGSRVGEFWRRQLREDMLHQFGCYAELKTLQLAITVPSTELGDRKYGYGLLLESLSGRRATMRSLSLQEEAIMGATLYGKTETEEEQLWRAERDFMAKIAASGGGLSDTDLSDGMGLLGGRQGSQGKPNRTTAALKDRILKSMDNKDSTGGLKGKRGGSSALELRRLAGPASGVSLEVTLEGDAMWQCVDKLRQVYLPDRASSPPLSMSLDASVAGLLNHDVFGRSPNLPLQPAGSVLPGYDGTAFSAFPSVVTRLPYLLQDVRARAARLATHVDASAVARFSDWLEQQRRSLLTRYYQVWSSSRWTGRSTQRRFGLAASDNPKLAVTTLVLGLRDVLKVPDVEANYEALQAVLGLHEADGLLGRLHVRPTLAILRPSVAAPFAYDVPLSHLHRSSRLLQPLTAPALAAVLQARHGDAFSPLPSHDAFAHMRHQRAVESDDSIISRRPKDPRVSLCTPEDDPSMPHYLSLMEHLLAACFSPAIDRLLQVPLASK